MELRLLVLILIFVLVLVPLNRMATGSSSEGTSSSRDTSECSESTVQVNVKTLDSQIYAFRVTKHVMF